jgi:hypothetical protein
VAVDAGLLPMAARSGCGCVVADCLHGHCSVMKGVLMHQPYFVFACTEK